MFGTVTFDTIDMGLRRGTVVRLPIQKIGEEGITFVIPQKGKYKEETIIMKPLKWQIAKIGDMLSVCHVQSGSMSRTQVLEIVKMKDGEIVDRIICKE